MTDDAALPSAICRRWIHSQEEDAEGLEVYRPEGFDFPPAFGRDGFEVCGDGSFIQYDTGPADEIVRTPGRWTGIGDRRVAVTLDDGREFAFDIVDVDDEVLRIRRG